MQMGRQHSALVQGLAIAAIVALAAIGFNHVWRDYQKRQAADAIVTLSGVSSVAGFTQKVARLRSFINDNSQHRQDSEFYATWRDQTYLAQRLVTGVNDQPENRVHLECSTRTALLTLALEAAGIGTRRIDIYDADGLGSHTFLDVLNPETGAYETHDPDYDITWRDRATLRPVSIAETATELDQVEPCGRTGCGWQVASRENFKAAKLKDYFDFISVKEETRRYTVYTPRAEPETVYEHDGKRGKFCDVLAENCQDGFFDIRDPSHSR